MRRPIQDDRRIQDDVAASVLKPSISLFWSTAGCGLS